MRGHHPVQLQATVRQQVVLHRGKRSIIDRQFNMRVRDYVAVAGKVLAAVAHPPCPQAGREGTGEGRDDLGITMEGTITDDARRTVIEIEHRREGVINTVCTQFGSQDKPHLLRRQLRGFRIFIPAFSQGGHARQPGKTFAETLHPATFVIDGDQQLRRAQCVDFCGQRRKLPQIGKVAREKNDAADERMTEPFTIEIGQCRAGDIDHQGTEG